MTKIFHKCERCMKEFESNEIPIHLCTIQTKTKSLTNRIICTTCNTENHFANKRCRNCNEELVAW